MQRHQARSAATSRSASSDGSLGDFSMENYTVDIAQLPNIKNTRNEAERGQGPQQGNDYKDTENTGDRNDEDDGDDEGGIMGEYTIDLGGFGDKPSSVIVNDREMERAEMPREDEGPEDFTVNLAKWMKGNEQWEKPKPLTDKCDGNDLPEATEPECGLPDNHAGGIDEESLFEPAGSSTPVSQRGCEKDHPAEGTNEALKAPPFNRSNTQLQEKAAEEVFERISALQAEVERMREEEESRRVEQHSWEVENEQLRKGIDEARQQLREWDELRQNEKKTEQEDNLIETKDAEKMRKADDQIKDLKIELKAAHERANRAGGELEASKQSQSDELSHLRSQLEKQKQNVETEWNKCLILAQEAAKLAENRQHHERTIQNLTDEATARGTELDHAYEQLRESSRTVEDIEDENDRLSQENERQARDISDMEQQLQGKDTEIRAAHATIAELRQMSLASEKRDDTQDKSIDAAIREITRKRETENEASITSMKTQHTKDLETLRSALQNAIQARQKSESVLKKSHNEQCFQLQEQITTLEERLNAQEEASSTHSIEDELRSAIRVLSNKLEKAYSSSRSARAEAEAARQDALASTEANEIINAELERRFAEAMETREKEWMRRANLLFRERDKMSKVLLQSWGTEEVGPAKKGERQAYRYKYVKGRF